MQQKKATKKKVSRSGKTPGSAPSTVDTTHGIQEQEEQHPDINLLPAMVDAQGELQSHPPGEEGIAPVWVPLALIDFSPLNYRKYYNPVALKEFAEGLKLQGIISPVTLRVVTKGRYELVVGERRIRAGRLAGLLGTPAIIREMTDEQVEDAQLAENVGREDSHPIHDAEAIGKMYARRMTTREIAARLGKSESWVYQRKRLCALLPAFQEMFLAGVLTHTDALVIAMLSNDVQQEMYNERCADWKEQDRTDLDYERLATAYTCRLKNAIFNLADPALYPEAGACHVCPHNSSHAGLLFSEDADDARCGKKACFQIKTRLHTVQFILSILKEHQPTAVILGAQAPDVFKEALATVPETKDLPTYDENDITLWMEPEVPHRADYSSGDDELFRRQEEDGVENEPEEGEEASFDEAEEEEAYATAMAEYQDDLAVYQAAIEEGKVFKAFYIHRASLSLIYFSPQPPVHSGLEENGKKVNIAEKIKAGIDTPEDLEAEIERIRNREKRNKELDRDKVQKEVHQRLEASLSEDAKCLAWQESDRVAARWIAYNSLPFHAKGHIERLLGLNIDRYTTKLDKIYEAFSNMTAELEALIFRTALVQLSDSKIPTTVTGFFLYRTAEGAGVDTRTIEIGQASKAQTRQDNQEVKITLYKKRIRRHRSKAV